MAALARQVGYKKLFVPAVDAPETTLIPGLEVYPVETRAALYKYLNGEETTNPAEAILPNLTSRPLYETDFCEIKGQEHIKRALEVAAAGGHNVLMF